MTEDSPGLDHEVTWNMPYSFPPDVNELVWPHMSSGKYASEDELLRAEVAILGGGVVGSNAAKVAAGLGANVRILDVNLDRLRYLDDIMPPNVTTLYSDRHTIRESIERADLVIGAVLITGGGRLT